ncbi:hypothetical protein DM02DRAFT_635289 [Periconia macrospinosa]|uniref:Uncharacterized protein n=1 Tax=Periconia macrospinosa TaxID=97972 RepID=A0A2V1D3C7_9PLEO|nr:hypothetical protein DM02DRAFT_635289 [Periconia macrospinosa]
MPELYRSPTIKAPDERYPDQFGHSILEMAAYYIKHTKNLSISMPFCVRRRKARISTLSDYYNDNHDLLELRKDEAAELRRDLHDLGNFSPQDRRPNILLRGRGTHDDFFRLKCLNEISSPKPTKAGDLLKPFNVHDAFNHDCFEQGPDPILGAVLSQTMFMPGAASAAPKLDATKLINSWVDKMGWMAAKTANGENMDPLAISV